MHQVTLHLGETTLTLCAGTAQRLLPIGLATLAQAFDHRMPNALALENAIANVEDAVMPATHWLPPDVQSASREAVEALFSALARQALQPGFHDLQLVQTPEFAAALLVLRESMHHWGMTELVALPAAD